MFSCDEALELLTQFGSDASWVGHSMAVSRLATSFAKICSKKYDVDVPFVQTAALLHDIGRCRDHHPIRHGVEGYRMMTGLGHGRVAHVCASHTLFGLTKDEAVLFGLPDQEFMPRDINECLIPLSDSLLESDKPTTLVERYSSLRRRYATNEFFFSRLQRAEKKARFLLELFERDFTQSFEDVAMDLFRKEGDEE